MDARRSPIEIEDGTTLAERCTRVGIPEEAGQLYERWAAVAAASAAYERVGADVLYAPGLRNTDEIRAVCAATSRPVNVLSRPDLSIGEIVDAGAQRVSTGGRLTWVAINAFAHAATAIRDHGDFSALDVSFELEQWLDS